MVYADNAATTKMSRTAIDAMLPYMETHYGNPSSLYRLGQEAAEALQSARETVAAVTAETFDSNQISDLCRWAVVQDDTVRQTNMTARQLKIALNDFHGGSGNLGYTQYQYDVKMADGSFCLLQYDYATPYADPALRDTLPDVQTCYILLLAVLILVWLGWQTHCTVRVFAAETARLHRAVDAIAAQQPERIDADGARLREFSATLHAMQTMGRKLTDSLQSQWRMEQQRAELEQAKADLEATIFMVTHDSFAASFCDRVIILHHGRVACDQRLGDMSRGAGARLQAAICGDMETLLPALRSLSSVARVTRLPAREAGVAEVLIEGKPGAVPQKELFTLLCGLQMPLMRLTPAADTLEDVFLRCTADDQALEKK